MLRSLLGFDCFNIGNGIALRLSIGDVINLMLQAFRSFLSVPGMRASTTEESFDFLNSLATCLGKGKEELRRTKEAECSKE